MPKTSLAIIFGGRSVEHEVSILTGHQALAAADNDKYDIHPVYIARDNVWYTGEEAGNLAFFKQANPQLSKLMRVYPAPDAMRAKLRLIESDPKPLRKPKVIEIDCVLPATHGTFVEDGALQGMFEMANVAFAGSGVRGSAVGMDKALFKSVLLSEGLPHLPYSVVWRDVWDADPAAEIARLERSLGLPLFIKPAVAGSSVGISRADDLAKLETGVDLALKFCERALIEKALIHPTEINCSVIDGDPPIASVLEQPVSAAELLTFDEKYKAGGGKKGAKTGGKGMAGQQRLIPAPLDKATAERIQTLAVQAFRAAHAGGVARIDFLIDGKGEVYINELNNIPGSLSFYLWEHGGRSFSQLIDRMVERAFEVQKIRNRTTYSFEANLLAGG